MKQFKKSIAKKRTLAMSLATAGMLTIGTMGTALADVSSQEPPQASGGLQGVFGDVTGKSANTLNLRGRGGETLVLTINKQTRFQIPGDVDPSLGDLAKGDRVAAMVRRDGNGLLALQVMTVPGQPQREHRVLTVESVNGRTLTAVDAQGNRVTVELNHEISPALAGQLTTFVGEKSQQSNRFKANTEVKIEQITERLEAHTARLQEQASAETDEATKVRKEREVTQRMEQLETTRQRQLDRLGEVIAKASPQAKDGLKRALARFEAQQAEDRARFEAQQAEARARFKEQYEARLRALENPQGRPQERPGAARPPIVDAANANSEARVVQGVVQAVDATAGKLALMTADGRVITLEARRGFDIRLGDRIVPLSEVAVGARVTAYYNPERLAPDVPVKAERLNDPVKTEPVTNENWTVLTGTLMSVEPGPGVITLGTREGSVLSLKVSPSASPQAQVALKELASALPGTQVNLKYLTSGNQIVELAFARIDNLGPKPAPAAETQATNALAEQELARKRLLQIEQEQARAKFNEEQKLALARFLDQQAMAMKQFHMDQELARAKFSEEQKLALARFLEQTKDEQAIKQFLADQELARAKFSEAQKPALTRFQADQGQAHAKFMEEQKLALARFQGQ